MRFDDLSFRMNSNDFNIFMLARHYHSPTGATIMPVPKAEFGNVGEFSNRKISGIVFHILITLHRIYVLKWFLNWFPLC